MEGPQTHAAYLAERPASPHATKLTLIKSESTRSNQTGDRGSAPVGRPGCVRKWGIASGVLLELATIVCSLTGGAAVAGVRAGGCA